MSGLNVLEGRLNSGLRSYYQEVIVRQNRLEGDLFFRVEAVRKHPTRRDLLLIDGFGRPTDTTSPATSGTFYIGVYHVVSKEVALFPLSPKQQESFWSLYQKMDFSLLGQLQTDIGEVLVDEESARQFAARAESSLTPARAAAAVTALRRNGASGRFFRVDKNLGWPFRFDLRGLVTHLEHGGQVGGVGKKFQTFFKQWLDYLDQTYDPDK